MKKAILLAAVLSVALSMHAQKGKVKTKTKGAVTSSATPGNEIKTSNDSLSYAFGYSIAQYMKSQGVTTINYGILNTAIQQFLTGEKPMMDASQCNMVMQNLQQKGAQLQQQQAEKAAAGEKEKGRKFLEENKMRAGVVETPSGLQYEVITKGSGPIPTIHDTVVAHYKGTLIDGKEFDNSYSRGEPLTIPVGGVIKGWTEALTMMPVGSKWKLYIPSSLGYGDYGAGQEIPGGATLVFEVELVGIKGKP